MADLTTQTETLRFINLARPILKEISIAEILERKAKFRKVDLKTISDDALRTEIKKVLEIQVNGSPKLVNIITSKIIGENHIHAMLYRIRKLTDDDMLKKSFLSMQKEKDAWYPPKTIIKKIGRLNDIGEAVLYLSESPLAAMKETHLQPKDAFYLIAYRTTIPFRISVLDSWRDIQMMTTEENSKLRLFNDFLVNEFTKDVGSGTEYLYRATNIIAKDYLHHSEKDIGWSYPSLWEKWSSNVCFKSDVAQKHLELLGVRVCRLHDLKDYNMEIYLDLIGFDDNGYFLQHECKSEISKNTFRFMNAMYFPDVI